MTTETRCVCGASWNDIGSQDAAQAIANHTEDCQGPVRGVLKSFLPSIEVDEVVGQSFNFGMGILGGRLDNIGRTVMGEYRVRVDALPKPHSEEWNQLVVASGVQVGALLKLVGGFPPTVEQVASLARALKINPENLVEPAD